MDLGTLCDASGPTTRMLFLVRPNIIIHREVENDLFGPGYDRPTGVPGNGGTTLP